VTHRKGLHCGSTALGDALRAKGLDLPEETVFGLGAGLGFSLWDGDTSLTPPQPSRFFVGRSGTFERDLCDVLGAELHQEHFPDAAQALARIDELLDQGDVPLAPTDLAELPYTGARGHWYGHLVAVARGAVWDNEYAEPQPISREQLGRALCNKSPVRGEGCTILHVTGIPRAVPRDAARRAIVLDALHMTEGGGIAAVEDFARELPELRTRPDRARIERLCGQVIEVRGCGGGLFRRIYARFLREAMPPLAPLCEAAAQAWSALAADLSPARALACAKAESALWALALELCE
jgi:hypothetical protein